MFIWVLGVFIMRFQACDLGGVWYNFYGSGFGFADWGCVVLLVGLFLG